MSIPLLCWSRVLSLSGLFSGFWSHASPFKNAESEGGMTSTSFKSTRPFAFDYVSTFFDFVPLEVRREMFLLEAKVSGECPYHLDSELQLSLFNLKRIPDPCRFHKKRLHFFVFPFLTPEDGHFASFDF